MERHAIEVGDSLIDGCGRCSVTRSAIAKMKLKEVYRP